MTRLLYSIDQQNLLKFPAIALVRCLQGTYRQQLCRDIVRLALPIDRGAAWGMFEHSVHFRSYFVASVFSYPIHGQNLLLKSPFRRQEPHTVTYNH